jgi:molybdate transport system substrate-binding protein
MSKNKFHTLALCAVSIAVLSANPVNATNINVAVAANFTSTLNTIIGAYRTATGNTVTVDSNSSAVLQSRIISHSVAYDLFLSADLTRPQQLATNNPSLVIGAPFLYAVGELELWSPTNNISAGLPATISQKLALADPSKAPYGTSAAQVLSSSPWSIPYTVGQTAAYPPVGTANVFIRPNISQTFSDVKNGLYAYGFVAQSAICTLVNNVKTFTKAGGFHHTYPFSDPAHPHNKIAQYGIKVVNAARTVPQETELTSFVNYLLTNATALNTIKNNCYALTL